MVSPQLMLTNHHVFPNSAEASRALAQFDYVLDINGIERKGPSFRVRPDLYYFADASLDFAVVAVDRNAEGGGGALSEFRYLRLNPRLHKINEGEFISIIQHPGGLPKQVALRENKLLSIEPNFLVYNSDTAQGSSGSPLFNDTWQIVGLHSAGVPKKNDQGRWLTKSGDVADDDTDDADIAWIGNRGARASRIVATLKEAPSGQLLSELLSIAHGTGESQALAPYPEFTGAPAHSTPVARISTLRIQATAGGARIDMPVGFTAEIGFGDPAATRHETPVAPADDPQGSEGVEAYKAPVIDTRYSNRKGYEESFLSETIKMPTVTRKSIASETESGDIAIPYEHFSIVMHKKRRLALFTACNVDARDKARKPEADKTYTRSALGGLAKGDIEMWVAEPRIDAAHQLPDAFFKNDRKAFDKGHIVRRDDVVWGKTYAQVRRANGDSFHVTNCSPQVASFNQSSKGGDWGLLENMILRQAQGERIVIFAGPVFDDEKDKPFKGEDENGDELVVQIPSQYWKIVVADGPEGLEAYGFVLKQSLKSVDWEFNIEADWVSALKPLSEIQTLAALIKFPKNVMDADMHDFIDAAESLETRELRRLPPKK
jgi:endonuclease G